MIAPIPPETPVVVARVRDDGRRSPPRLTVTVDVLSEFRMVPSYPPGGAPRLAATIRHTREWTSAETETVIVDPARNSPVLLAALGHRVAGHLCADCVV